MECPSGGKVALICLWLKVLTFTVRHPLCSVKKMSHTWLKLLICLYAYSLHEKLTKNMGPHCIVRPEHLLVAIWTALTLELIKSLCTVSTLWLVFFGLMVLLSHFQRLCHLVFDGRVLEYDTLWTGSLWHFGRRLFGKAFVF